MNRVAEELRTLTIEELNQKIDEMRRELFSLKLNTATSHVKNFSQFKKLRRGIACGLTLKTEKTRIEFLKFIFDALNAGNEQAHE